MTFEIEEFTKAKLNDLEVLTIEQEPLQPFAMGHFRTVVSTRPARTAA